MARPMLLLPMILCLCAGRAHAQKRAAEMDLAGYDAKIKPEDRQHWAFRPVRKPPLPQVRERSRVRNPIDAFVLSRLESEGWKPNAPAAPRALLRRVHLDLAGLPPTLAEQ